MVSKYVDHLPIYRQIQMFKHIGISLPPSSIKVWSHEVADLMRPAYYRLKKLTLSAHYVQSDETNNHTYNRQRKSSDHKRISLAGTSVMNNSFFSTMMVKHKSCDGILQGLSRCQTDGYTSYEILEMIKGIIIIFC